MNIAVYPLEDYMVKRGGSVNPRKFEEEIFDLLSISGFDNGSPEISAGKEIGSTKQCVEPRDVLLSKIVPHIRRCWVVPEKEKNRQIASGEWIVFRNKDWHPEYVKYFLTSDVFHAQFMNTVAGVGGSLLRARPAFVSKIPIPLPPLEEQRRIVEILDAAQGLIDQRKEQISLMDQLVQSLFYDMFGDPVSNPMGWEVKRLGDVLAIKHGFAFKSDLFSEQGEYVLLTPGNFHECGGYKDRGKKQKFYVGDIPSDYLLKTGALLLAMTEQAPGLLGSPAFIPDEGMFLHNQRLGLVVHDSTLINLGFLFCFCNTDYFREEIQFSSTGTKVKHTSPSKIQLVGLPLPPLSLQNQFAERVEKIETQKSAMLESLSELEDTFNALMQRAFKGELGKSE